ncbi:MAG: hypothetical protein AAB590_01230 [Patescibacteria group bacterium]
MRFITERGFDKQFTKLSPKVRQKFEERWLMFIDNQTHPLLENHPLNPPFAGSRSINVTGDYRAIFKQINPDLIIFTDIGTHHQLFGT